jgi:hypothetical protein
MIDIGCAEGQKESVVLFVVLVGYLRIDDGVGCE